MRLGTPQSRVAFGKVAGAERMSIDDKTRVISAVKSRAPATLAIRWSDGTRAELDLADLFRDKAFKQLRNSTEFVRVRVGEWGHSVEWPGGAELSAEMLWLETLSATGHRDTREFLEWRLRHGLSLTKTAEALGLSRRMVAYYSNGEKPVPRPILLACKGWEVSSAA
jgi:hypothetical protein